MIMVAYGVSTTAAVASLREIDDRLAVASAEIARAAMKTAGRRIDRMIEKRIFEIR